MMIAVICVGAVLGVASAAVSVIFFGASLLLGFGLYLAVTLAFFGLALTAVLRRAGDLADTSPDWPSSHRCDARPIRGTLQGHG